MRIVATVLAAWMTAIPSLAQSQQSSVVPLDEAARDPEFFVFRARLQRAAAAHDTAAVMGVVAPRILNSFGGDGGLEEFREKWRIANPEKSELWSVLGFVLAMEDGLTAIPRSMRRTPFEVPRSTALRR